MRDNKTMRLSEILDKHYKKFRCGEEWEHDHTAKSKKQAEGCLVNAKYYGRKKVIIKKNKV